MINKILDYSMFFISAFFILNGLMMIIDGEGGGLFIVFTGLIGFFLEIISGDNKK